MADQDMTENQRYCIAMLTEWAGGRHHLPKVRGFGHGVSIYFTGDISTYDGNRLTELVILAHAYGVRIEIAPAMRYVRIIAHKRTHGDRKLMRSWEWHPTLDDLTARINQYKTTNTEN